MTVVWYVVLGLFAAFSLLDASTILSKAETSIHQIYGALLLLVTVVSLSGIGIIQTIKGTQIKRLKVVDPKQNQFAFDDGLAGLAKRTLANCKNTFSGQNTTPEPTAQPASDPTPTTATPHARFCPECGADDIPMDVATCPKCTRILPENPMFCPRCGHEITHKPAFCPGCGGKFRYKDKPAEPAS